MILGRGFFLDHQSYGSFNVFRLERIRCIFLLNPGVRVTGPVPCYAEDRYRLRTTDPGTLRARRGINRSQILLFVT